MATEKIDLTAPAEPVGATAEDTQKTVAAAEAADADTTEDNPGQGSMLADGLNDRFADEEAALAADKAGLDMGEESAEEQAADDAAAASQEAALAAMNKNELIELFASKIENEPVQTLRRTVEAIKIAFYKRHRAETEAARRAFVEAGGEETEFVPQQDGCEARFKELFAVYREHRDKYMSEVEQAKQGNLETKLAIIEELKELVNSDETMNTTFARFRELQQRWKETGPVPQADVKDVWESYNFNVENFYNFIKINKELRDLDLRKNYESKISLCEQAEALVMEPSVVEAFRKLQKLHDEWRETGPVANEYKETLWERFREASSRINKQHQEYFEGLKSEQMKNLELKTELCERSEALLTGAYTTRKEWNKASDQLLEIQKVWKTIGFAPKKDNNRIYERFRTACDRFFELKRDFYAGVKSEMEHNLALKQEICEQAEALQASEDWKHATDELIALQARWKTIGAVSRRHSDQIWRRFRAACDRFFERKAQHFSAVDGEYEQNLQRKQELLAQMRAADIHSGGFDMIKGFPASLERDRLRAYQAEGEHTEAVQGRCRRYVRDAAFVGARPLDDAFQG